MFDLLPYKKCVGRKYRFLPQLYRPFTIMFSTTLCNCYFTDKNKIRFIKQLFRWFYKHTTGFKVEPFLKWGKKCELVEGDIIYLACRTQKAAWKKLLSKLNYQLSDYKILKRRKYCLTFTFILLIWKVCVKIFIWILSVIIKMIIMFLLLQTLIIIRIFYNCFSIFM